MTAHKFLIAMALVGASAVPALAQGITQSMNPAANHSASTPDKTKSKTVGTSSAPAVEQKGVGTSANGLPIGTPGSGPGSPEQPIDSGTR